MGKFSVDTKMKAILRNPEAAAVLEKYAPGMKDDPSINLVSAMTLRKVLAFPECAEIAVYQDEIDKELQAIE